MKWLIVFGLAATVAAAQAQSLPLPTDRARVTVASIADPFGGPNLKVLRTDANTPLRAGTAWIWEKQRQEEPESYYVSMRSNGLNAVRMILFDTLPPCPSTRLPVGTIPPTAPGSWLAWNAR